MGRKNRKVLWSTCRKTELCQNFLNGCCTREECRFAHSTEELQDRPNLSRTKLCRAVMDGKECTREGCTFAHSEEELVPVPPQVPTPATRSVAPGSRELQMEKTVADASVAPVRTPTPEGKPAASTEPKVRSASTAQAARPRRSAPMVVRSEKMPETVVVSLSAELRAPQQLVLMEELGLSPEPHSKLAPRSMEQHGKPLIMGQSGLLAPQRFSTWLYIFFSRISKVSTIVCFSTVRNFTCRN